MRLVSGLPVVLAALALSEPPAARGRRLFAWTHENEAEAAQQLRDHPGLFDGIFVGYCGVHINTTDPLKPHLHVTDYYNAPRCRAVTDAAKELGVELHMWLDMENSAKTFPPGQEAQVDVTALIDSTVAAAREHGWAGVNFDDESETCPRRSPERFAGWVQSVNAWAAGVQAQGVQFTADIQALTCSVCEPWPACLDRENETYAAEYDHIQALMTESPVQRWIEMDTYYGGLGHFYDNLDFYSKRIPREKLGVGIMPNANPTNHDQTIARFHSISLLEVDEVDLFKLPLTKAAGEEYFPVLAKWKNRCGDCRGGGELSCWKHCSTIHKDPHALLRHEKPALLARRA